MSFTTATGKAIAPPRFLHVVIRVLAGAQEATLEVNSLASRAPSGRERMRSVGIDVDSQEVANT